MPWQPRDCSSAPALLSASSELLLCAALEPGAGAEPPKMKGFAVKGFGGTAAGTPSMVLSALGGCWFDLSAAVLRIFLAWI